MKIVNKLTVTLPSDREIVMMRSFDAPRQLVWDAMTRPDMIRNWLFAPPGWTLAAMDDDLRVGGRFRWTWTGPDGTVVMAMHGEYREVAPPGRVVRTETFDTGCPGQMGEQLATIVLTEHGGKTHMTLTVSYPSKEARDATLASGMEHGMSAGYDQLDVFLADRVAA